MSDFENLVTCYEFSKPGVSDIEIIEYPYITSGTNWIKPNTAVCKKKNSQGFVIITNLHN